MSANSSITEVQEKDTWGTKDHLTTEQEEALVKFTSVAKESDLNLAKSTESRWRMSVLDF